MLAMNSLTLVLLLFVTYFFWSSGATFLAVLTLAVAFIVALGSPQQQPAAHPAYPGMPPGTPMPIVVQAGGGGQAFPRKFEFRPNFPGDPDGDEWISGKLGQWIVLFVRAFAKLFSLGRPKSEEGGH